MQGSANCMHNDGLKSWVALAEVIPTTGIVEALVCQCFRISRYVSLEYAIQIQDRNSQPPHGIYYRSGVGCGGGWRRGHSAENFPCCCTDGHTEASQSVFQFGISSERSIDKAKKRFEKSPGELGKS